MARNNKNLFFTIGDVTERTGVKPYILRYWEKEFPFLQPLKNKSGHRLYTKRDVSIIQTIRYLIYDKGYSISGAKRVLWNILLKRNQSPLQKMLEEIRDELHLMLEHLEKSKQT